MESLAIAYQELGEKLGDWLGYGRGATAGEKAWNDNQDRTVQMFLKEGLSDFYFSGHQWSFLRPIVTLTLLDGERTTDLPEDIGGVEGRVFITNDGGTFWTPLDFGMVNAVQARESEQPSQEGRPNVVCVEAVQGVSKNRSNRQRLRFHPAADQDYTVKFQGYVNPAMLSGTYPYAYGGPQHAHTILQAAKAAAERHDGIKDGPEQMNYREKLAASVLVDSRLKPQDFGYNADYSDAMDLLTKRRVQFQPVTIGGMTP